MLEEEIGEDWGKKWGKQKVNLKGKESVTEKLKEGEGKGKGKEKGNVGRPSKQSSHDEDNGEWSGLHDSGNIDDVPKENLNGLSDIDEYDSDEMPNEYDCEDEHISKADF